MSQLTVKQKLQRGLLAAGAVAVIFAGTTYGAGLKIRSQLESERQKLHEATLEEQIAILETQKKHLLSQKGMWENKLSNFHQRVLEREKEKKS